MTLRKAIIVFISTILLLDTVIVNQHDLSTTYILSTIFLIYVY